MIRTLREVVLAALEGTSLAERESMSLPIGDGTETAFAIRIGSSEIMSAWTEARNLLPDTGYWPVVTACWSRSEGTWSQRIVEADLFTRFPYRYPGAPLDLSPPSIILRSAAVDVGRWLQVRAAELHFVEEEAELEEDATETPDAGYLEWLEPEEPALLLLPTEDSWATLAYLSWFAADGLPAESFLALLRSWHERYGAELVVHFGTMLGFSVARPPGTLREAMSLAREHVLVAPCTTLLPGIPVLSYARALVDNPRWFLHERP